MITNPGHCGHMTWYILNVPGNVPSQVVVVTSVWYILNILNMCQFGNVLVYRPSPYNVLAMYQVGTLPLAPSESPRTMVGPIHMVTVSSSLGYISDVPGPEVPLLALVQPIPGRGR